MSSAVLLLGACSQEVHSEDPVERMTFKKTANAVRPEPLSAPGLPHIYFRSDTTAKVIDTRDSGVIGTTPCAFDVSEPVPVCLRALGYEDYCFVVAPGVEKVFDVQMQPIAAPMPGRRAHRSEAAIDSAIGEIDGIIRSIEVGKKTGKKRR